MLMVKDSEVVKYINEFGNKVHSEITPTKNKFYEIWKLARNAIYDLDNHDQKSVRNHLKEIIKLINNQPEGIKDDYKR